PQMSLSSRLCLLTIVALILPSRGQTPKKPTSIFTADQTSATTRDNVPDPDQTSPGVQTTPLIWTREAEATGSQTAAQTETQQLTKMATSNPVSDPGPHTSSKKGTPAVSRIEPLSPSKNFMPPSYIEHPLDSNENNPFYYDDTTLRKRGLLVAAVLFITGIIILTSESRAWAERARRGWGRAGLHGD
ncbi:FXYD domain-containing ion transport regulator 5, isoform CRA_b, partial [Mus musculus]